MAKGNRFNLYIGDKELAKLKALAKSGEISLSEVVRRSLAVYEFLDKEKRSGGKLVIRSTLGGEKEVVLL